MKYMLASQHTAHQCTYSDVVSIYVGAQNIPWVPWFQIYLAYRICKDNTGGNGNENLKQ